MEGDCRLVIGPAIDFAYDVDVFLDTKDIRYRIGFKIRRRKLFQRRRWSFTRWS